MTGIEIPESKVRWMAGLSNGETIVEGKGIAEEVKGENSAWHKLQEYLQLNSLTINSFALIIGDRHYYLPSIKPKFNGLTPMKYNCFRKVEENFMGREYVKHYTCAEVIYPEERIQIWIDENDLDKMWLNIIENNNGATDTN